ncbi:molybdopterin-dependent oxidoreductase [Nocardioides terrisoli]|uniref:molybdopterin-dependent oxidoreductase n=1 Tax=Nocardioides terrisoli TaxID=3388267 RepID=UPI00287BBDD0|nr:molybdopterin-dependent oxidoreductase [Nocardioides marmorisolisilvae]
MREDDGVGVAAGVQRRWFALAGVVAGASGVALSVAVAWALHAETNPVLAVAAEVRDLTPGPIAERLINVVGHADKPLLTAGTVVVLLALCAGIGLLARVNEIGADLAFLALGAIGLLAVRSQPHADGAATVSVVVGLVGWVVVLRLLDGRLAPVVPVASPDLSRRTFLAMSGGVVLVSGLALWAGRIAGRGRRAAEEARRLIRLPFGIGKEPAGADLGVPHVLPWRTPNQQFYLINTALSAPSITPSEWSLRIHGMIDRELTLTYEDLAARRLSGAWVTLCCVSNTVGGPLIGNAYWSGVPIRDLLAEVGVHPGADAVKQTSYDGWTCGTPLSALTDGRNALLAMGMNGQPLPIEHGFPVRMVVPGLYGYVSATKWLVDLEVTRFDRFRAYWTERGWSARGPVKTESRIDYPGDGWAVDKGTLAVGGSAWAQHTGIAKVEVQLDGGPWRTARLGSVPDKDTWVQWTLDVDAPAGTHELRVRATDRTGYTQTPVERDVVPNGATGWHTVRFKAS